MIFGKFANGLVVSLMLLSSHPADAQVEHIEEADDPRIASWNLERGDLSDEELRKLWEVMKNSPRGSDSVLLKIPSDHRQIPQNIPARTADDIKKWRYYELPNVKLEDLRKDLKQAGVDPGEPLVVKRPVGGDPRTQQTIGSLTGGAIIDAFTPSNGGGASVLGQPSCLAASNELRQTQSVAALLGKRAGANDKVNALAYIAACLEPITALASSSKTPIFVRNSDPLRVMGVFEYLPPAPTAGEAFCSGFFISPTRVVTARHCFYRDNKAGSRLNEYTKLEAGLIVFRRLSPPYEQIRLSEDISNVRLSYFQGTPGSKAITAQEDFIVLKTQKPIAGLPDVGFAQGVPVRTSTWLAGPAVVATEKNDLPKAVSAVGWGSGMECSAFPADSSCVVHICQAVSSFSGAPLIDPSSTGNKVVVLGMHLGPYSRVSQQCSLPESMSAAERLVINKSNSAVSGARLDAAIRQYYP